MKLHFVKISPTKNMTILITDPVPRPQQSAVAERLMACDSVHGEQVGFLEEAALPGARLRLQMMGGEFCGNASMSAAAWLARQDGLADSAAADYPLEVSGAEGLVVCRIERRGDCYSGTVAMPLPVHMEKRVYGPGCVYPTVFFDGIIHCIVPENAMTDAEAEVFAREQCARQDAEAFGVLLVNGEMTAFRPLVYVRSTDSGVWERGCGSGTAAIGAYLAAQQGGAICAELRQPGGSMQVQADAGKIFITGTVKIVAEGAAWLE